MSEAWIPIIFTALIVFGVVGGQLAHTVLKRLLPLLETYLKEAPNRRAGGADGSAVAREVHHLEERVSLLESRDRELRAQVSFLESLLEPPRTEQRGTEPPREQPPRPDDAGE